MAWLLGRRGYSPVVFEQNARVGGKVRNSAASAQKEEHLHFIYIFILLMPSSLPLSLSPSLAPIHYYRSTDLDTANRPGWNNPRDGGCLFVAGL